MTHSIIVTSSFGLSIADIMSLEDDEESCFILSNENFFTLMGYLYPTGWITSSSDRIVMDDAWELHSRFMDGEDPAPEWSDEALAFLTLIRSVEDTGVLCVYFF